MARANNRTRRLGLPPRPHTWQCRACAYHPNGGEFCTNCGRTYWGEDGVVPKIEDKPHRPGLRGG